MRPLTIEQGALVSEVDRAWQAYWAERRGAEARVRALVAADVAKSVGLKLTRVGEALRVALEAGVPKVRLKEVTTKDRKSFNALLPVPAVAEQPSGAQPPDVEPPYVLEWIGEHIRVTLDSTQVPETDCDRRDARCWTQDFEHVVRPSDGKEMLIPAGEYRYPHGVGVMQWFDADRAAIEQVVIDWVHATRSFT
jgi:hypothetical protein